MFNEFEDYLQNQGYSARDGLLVDASLVEVPCQRNKRWAKHPAKYRQKDKEARWTHKHGQNYYGYKNHISVDSRYQFIQRFQVTSATTGDGQLFPQLLNVNLPDNERYVYADNAYRTLDNITYCVD